MTPVSVSDFTARDLGGEYVVDMTEPDILNGMRGLTGAQSAFAGVADPVKTRFITDCGWYGTDVDEHEGFFCLAQADSALEDLIGEVVQIRYGVRSVLVYCVGATELPGELSLARTAYMQLAPLNVESIPVQAQGVLRANA